MFPVQYFCHLHGDRQKWIFRTELSCDLSVTCHVGYMVWAQIYYDTFMEQGFCFSFKNLSRDLENRLTGEKTKKGQYKLVLYRSSVSTIKTDSIYWGIICLKMILHWSDNWEKISSQNQLPPLNTSPYKWSLLRALWKTTLGSTTRMKAATSKCNIRPSILYCILNICTIGKSIQKNRIKIVKFCNATQWEYTNTVHYNGVYSSQYCSDILFSGKALDSQWGTKLDM